MPERPEDDAARADRALADLDRALADLDRRVVVDEDGRLVGIRQPARPWALVGLILGAGCVPLLLAAGDTPVGEYELADYVLALLGGLAALTLPLGLVVWSLGRWSRRLGRVGGAAMGLGLCCLIAVFVILLAGLALPLGGSESR